MCYWFFFVQDAIKTITESFNQINQNTVGKTTGKTEASHIQAENENVRKAIFDVYGWHILASEIAKYCNCSFFQIMETSAMEVAGLTALVQNHTIYNQHANG